MSKFSKLLKHPGAFFADALRNRLERNPPRRTTYVIGFSTWKQYMRRYFPERNLVFLPKDITEADFNAHYRKAILGHPEAELFIWGYKAPAFLFELIHSHGLRVIYVEDGFIRSVKLGATLTPARSLCLDTRAHYFNAREASDLEILLNETDFRADPALLARARAGMERLIRSRISKYNNAAPSAGKLYPPAKRRVLVLGQVEDDASILYGCERAISNNEAVHLAADENPDAQIIYKIHPDVLNRHRPQRSDPDEVRDRCHILKADIPLADALEGIDHVYTITSLGGFEALMRGIDVTTIGCPFYSGWGLTDDRQFNPRRKRRLTLEEVFAAAYLLYPRYFDPDTGRKLTFEQTLDQLSEAVEAHHGETSRHDGRALTGHLSSPGGESRERPEPPTARSPKAGKLLPVWFRSEHRERLVPNDGKPVYLYIPWIAEHGDAVIASLRDKGYHIVALDLFDGIRDGETRQAIRSFALEEPGTYRRMVLRRLIPLREKITAILFSFDWAPAMRVVVSVCRELGIPTLLIPHESVFVDRERYYVDPKAGASFPSTDLVLGWGALQAEIFTERGYPADRFQAMGTPKFDRAARPLLNRRDFCRLYGLRPGRALILFAAQPLDSQINVKTAREGQRRAIRDLLSAACERDWQLLIRMPPSRDDILGKTLRDELEESERCAIDEAEYYLVPPGEALVHCDLVTSVNSTMLLEGVLSGRPALSINYIGIRPIWEQAEIPVITAPEELPAAMADLLQAWAPSENGMRWAADRFSPGQFDNRSGERIRHFLTRFGAGETGFRPLPTALERVLDPEGDAIDLAAIHSSPERRETTQKYLAPLLRARQLIYTRETAGTAALASVDLFVQWGISPCEHKSKQARLARELGRQVVIVEDGLIRSVGIGLSGEPGLSIILDDTTAYYDATRPSRLQRLLESGPELSARERKRSADAIAKLVRARVSKYNHAPDLPLRIGRPGKPKVLLVDQRYDDQSIISGLATARTFEQMLQQALGRGEEWDVIIKQHPDAIKGGQQSYFSDEKLGNYPALAGNLFVVNFDINPYALFEQVDEVWVVTSGMGFEALMAGKRVHCHGAPFYAGWGLTLDRFPIPNRTRLRTLEEVFHYAYIASSRYFHPEEGRIIPVEEMVDYIANQKALPPVMGAASTRNTPHDPVAPTLNQQPANILIL
ncbi:MAG TPA: hypothetical protein VNQ90_20085 [Chthoniobacteraceae bacterium]|nr:hypothetical protein [Chthoniobacteraceae bacterium]